MGFLKTLASLGIGAATVDIHLHKERFYPGDVVIGEVHIIGGVGEQRIEDVYLYVMVEMFKKQGQDKEIHILEKYRLVDAFLVKAHEHQVRPFEFQLPVDLPVSSGGCPVYFKTGLELKFAKDPTDLEKIEILPAPMIQKLLTQIETAGFILYKVETIYDPKQQPRPFFQLFQYHPSERYHGYVDELNVYFDITATEVRMDIVMIRATQQLQNSFVWDYTNPADTLVINNQKVGKDPVETIQKMLTRKTIY